MAQPGTTPIAAPVDTTALGDTYPSHKAKRGLGGYRSVADNTERDAITVDRREQGMLVHALDSGITYILEADLTTWTVWNDGSLPADVMLKSVYDPNDDGIVTNSDLLDSQTPAYYLARANHTGTQAISTIVGLQVALDAKINSSLIGVANGVVPTNGSNLIDNSYLGFALPLDPAVAWNPVTNTPSISDAGGSAGEIYIVYDSANPTARDLGSGSIDWNDGDLVIYDSGTSAFVNVAQIGVGVAQVTTALGVQTGNVTIDDTSYIDPSTDRNYLTDDEQAGIAASPTPITASNPAASQADITSIIVGASGRFGPETFANGETLGNGTLRTLTSLGYTNGSAGAVWTRVNSAYTIDVTTMDIDWICWQEAMLAMQLEQYNDFTAASARAYTPYNSINLPLFQPAGLYSEAFNINLGQSSLNNLTGNPFPILNRYPVNQAAANGAMLNWRFIIHNGTFRGAGLTNPLDCAIRMGACTTSTFEQLKIKEVGIGIDAQFALQTWFNKIDVNNFRVYGLASRDGLWSGAAADISQSNNTVFDQCHFAHDTGNVGISALATIYCQGNRNTTARDIQFEGGGTPQSLFLYDMYYPGGGNPTTVKNCATFTNVDIESTVSSRAAFRIISPGNVTFKLDTWFAQAAQPCLVECDGGSGYSAPNYIVLDNARTWGNAKFRNIERHKWEVANTQLVNNTSLTNSSNWFTDFSGFVPLSVDTRYTPVIGW